MSDLNKAFQMFRAKERPSNSSGSPFLCDKDGNLLLDENDNPIVDKSYNRDVFGKSVGLSAKIDRDGYLKIEDAQPLRTEMSDVKEVFSHHIDTLSSQVAHSFDKITLKEVQDILYSHSSNTVQHHDLSLVPGEVVLSEAFIRFSKERILAELIRSLNYEPTTAAVNRTLEFFGASCVRSFVPPGSFYSDKDTKTTFDNREEEVEAELNELCSQLKHIPIVSRARLIYCEFPETASISVQFIPDVLGDDEQNSLQELERLIMSYKPDGLIELEVSITNKVVY